MSLIERLQSVTLESFLAEHPEIDAIRTRHTPALPERIDEPLEVLAAESAYNEKAMSYVCALGGVIGERSTYHHKFLVQSQVMAAFSVEEGGFSKRGFLDPHSSLREFMMTSAAKHLGETPPDVAFAHDAARRMGQVYLWREGMPPVADEYAAMLGAHFASEYLAASQEFPSFVRLFERDQPELMKALRAEKEGHFGFSAADWLEGHPAVELKHAAYAGKAVEAAAWGMSDPGPFWASFFQGFEAFCRNDAAYFAELARR